MIDFERCETLDILTDEQIDQFIKVLQTFGWRHVRYHGQELCSPFQMLFFLWIRRANLWCMTTTVEVSWSQAWTGKLLFSCQSGLSWVNKKWNNIFSPPFVSLYLLLFVLFLEKKNLGDIKFKKMLYWKILCPGIQIWRTLLIQKTWSLSGAEEVHFSNCWSLG